MAWVNRPHIACSGKGLAARGGEATIEFGGERCASALAETWTWPRQRHSEVDRPVWSRVDGFKAEFRDLLSTGARKVRPAPYGARTEPVRVGSESCTNNPAPQRLRRRLLDHGYRPGTDFQHAGLSEILQGDPFPIHELEQLANDPRDRLAVPDVVRQLAYTIG